MVDLLVAAHRDDEILGAGGVLANATGFAVVWLGEIKRCRAAEEDGGLRDYQQAEKALAAVGASEHVLYESGGRWAQTLLPDNAFDTRPLLYAAQLVEQAIREVRPHAIYTHHPHDLNVDHRLTCQAVLTATRPTPGQTVKAVYGFEVPSSTEWAFGSPGFQPNVFVDITQTMEKKLEALRCYQSELRDYPHPRSERAVRARAEYWGQVAGVEYAEAFVLLREIRG